MPAPTPGFHEAKEAVLPEVAAWGTGSPRRECMHIDNCADACALLLNVDALPDGINVGAGSDATTLELTEIVADTVRYRGCIPRNSTAPIGTPRPSADTKNFATLRRARESVCERES